MFFMRYGGIFDLSKLQKSLEDLEKIVNHPEAWKDPKKTKSASAKHRQISSLLTNMGDLSGEISDAYELLDMVSQEDDQDLFDELMSDTLRIEEKIQSLEMQRFFTGKQDEQSAYLDIQAGSGGIEAQDWAQMLLRMYTRWAEDHGFEMSVLQVMNGEVAGIRNATIQVKGAYAFGWLKTESGVHRLVRKSPFDSGSRRHTSFASVFIYPEVDESISIDVNPADLRVDTYRSSGAGGQHVNTTDSAVRVTHLPTGVVVQCQAERSQHKNRASAMKQLQAKLNQVALDEQNQEKLALEESKDDITWGQQIRSYVLDQSRIKDLRTGVESSNPQSVLDGGLDVFIRASLQENATHESNEED